MRSPTVFLGCLLALTACVPLGCVSFGRLPTPEQIAKLREGMTPDEVRALLGKCSVERHTGESVVWAYGRTSAGLGGASTKFIEMTFVGGRLVEWPR